MELTLVLLHRRRLHARTFGPASCDLLGNLTLAAHGVNGHDAAVQIQQVQQLGNGGVPRQIYLPVWRQSVLPVHLLGLDALLGSVGAVAGDVKLQDDGVMHHPVNRRGGGHGVGKDALPLREDQVRRDTQRPVIDDN